MEFAGPNRLDYFVLDQLEFLPIRLVAEGRALLLPFLINVIQDILSPPLRFIAFPGSENSGSQSNHVPFQLGEEDSFGVLSLERSGRGSAAVTTGLPDCLLGHFRSFPRSGTPVTRQLGNSESVSSSMLVTSSRLSMMSPDALPCMHRLRMIRTSGGIRLRFRTVSQLMASSV
jgi:hypothetical protein